MVIIIKRKKVSGLSILLETNKRTVEIHIANKAKLTHAYLIKIKIKKLKIAYILSRSERVSEVVLQYYVFM